MKHQLYRFSWGLLFFSICTLVPLHAQFEGYRTPEQVEQWVKQIAGSHPGKIRTLVLATSPGQRPVTLIEIGNETGKTEKSVPAVLVTANFEGTRPLATEGAIRLAEMILDDPARYDSLNWYIVPVGNPDAATRFFRQPLYEDPRNDLPTNDDRDEMTDEDGPEDLNKDGWITLMRVKHPDGTWMVSEEDPRLMKEADPRKGELGVYKVYTEGIDNDGDGLYNEDGPGGTNVNINFPFLFQYFKEPSGRYPGSAPEAYALMKFVFEHPDIAMIFSFGSTNFCLAPPRGDRKGEADLSRLRVPERFAQRFGIDASRTYTMEEMVKAFREALPGEDIDESDIAGILGLGAAVNPREGDLVFYKKYASDYKDFLKEQGKLRSRFDPEPAPDGSLELWGYFDVGVPVFSMDLWGIPKAEPDSTSAGKGKPGKGDRGPGNGPDEPGKELALLNFSDSLLGKEGFANWQSYDHPSLGEVEIGGFRPFLFHTPPYEIVDTLLTRQIPWVFHLAGELPDLHILTTELTAMGEGVYRLEAWVENRSFIPFPTYMGKRNRQPAPAVLFLEGDQHEILTGTRRTPIGSVDGKSRVKITWVIQTDRPTKLTLNLESKNGGQDRKTINIGG
ncbi:MAG: M14 family metallopeptidase [Bacteroidales bacterium]